MKIDYLRINSRFKNLDSITVNFDENQLTTVVVGWNGAGKSNVIEALVAIFRDLDLGESPRFAYEIKYKLGEGNDAKWVKVTADPALGKTPAKQYKIQSAPANAQNLLGEDLWENVVVSKVVRDKDGNSPYLPKHVFAYYSGPSDRLESYFKKHRANFYRDLLYSKLNIKGAIRPLFYAKPIHSQFVLLAFYLDAGDSRGIQFLSDRLGIEGLDSVHFVFRRASWTRSENKNKLFWGVFGVVRDFLDLLFPYSVAPIKINRTEDINWTGGNLKNDFLHLFLPDIDSLHKVAASLSPDEFFKMLESTLLSDIISEVRVRVRVKNVEQALSFRELSEGEQQLLTVLGLLKFTGAQDSLFLLDEPDTHLNPAWDVKYLQFLNEFVPNQSSSQVIMITHNPLAIAELEKEQVQIMWRDVHSNVYATEPEESPRGMGYAGILTSDMFGLGSTLDEYTKNLLRERVAILEKDNPTGDEKKRLNELNDEIESLGFSSFHWDSEYAQYLRLRKEIYPDIFASQDAGNPSERKLRRETARKIVRKILEKEAKNIDG